MEPEENLGELSCTFCRIEKRNGVGLVGQEGEAIRREQNERQEEDYRKQ